jgi:hypothetical protein
MSRLSLIPALVSVTSLFAASISGSGVPVTTVVTALPQKGATVPQLTPNDLLVTHDKQALQVTSAEPVRGRQLWLLIDDGIAKNLTLQYDSLRSFIRGQSASSEVGVGFIRNGMVRVSQPLTRQHELAAAALRIPSGPPGISASPYIAISDLIRHWPANGGAREILMITSGIDPDYGNGPDNPYLLSARDDAQRAGITVDSIYYFGGNLRHWGIFWGQNDLAQLSDETGGEFYWEGNQSPVTLTPYLNNLDRRLNSQYLVTFIAPGRNKAGLENIKVTTEVHGVKLSSPARVYVPAE